MNKLTDEQKKKYLENSHHCPYCGSDQIEGGSIEGENAYQKVGCNDCYKEWRDVYKLTDVKEIE